MMHVSIFVILLLTLMIHTSLATSRANDVATSCLKNETSVSFPNIAFSKCLLSASVSSVGDSDDNCALACTLEAISVYWKCAIDCVQNGHVTECITAKCVGETIAFDIPCLNDCNQDTKKVEK